MSGDRTVWDGGMNPEPGQETVEQKAGSGNDGRDAEEESYVRGSLLLDTYRIDSGALRGGMGSVWRVHHMGWNTDLAMKRPQRKYFTDDASRSNFIAECRSWIGLGLHPNIVSCYYVREVDGVPTIFSEWMENGSLENRIEDGTLYEGEDAEVRARLLDIAIQYARGLRYAHDSGLIHQDVKPDNLLLTPDWQAKAADFGLARARAVLTMAETDGDAGKTQMAASGGYTPAYCSMEQMDGKQLTRRTDIYSWAVSVLEMYLGARPWQNGVVAGMSCASYFPQCRVPMPEALQQLLEHCLEMNPEDRPHDFGVVEQELKSIYRGVTGKDYARPEPHAAADTADSLNNRALSYLDLKQEKQAEKLWEDALMADIYHAESFYNLNLLRWRRQTFRDDYDRREKERQFRDRLVTLKINVPEKMKAAVELGLQEISGAGQAPMLLSRVRDVNLLLSREAEWQEKCARMRASLDGQRIPEAISILEEMRAMEGFAYGPEYQRLASELAGRCRKKRLRGVRRSVIYFPVAAMDADISENGLIIACNLQGVQIYDAWKSSATRAYDLKGDGRTPSSRSKDKKAGAGGQGMLFTMATSDHFGIGDSRDYMDIVRHWNPENGKCLRKMRATVNTELKHFEVSRDGTRVIAVDGGAYCVYAWNVPDTKYAFKWESRKDPVVKESGLRAFETGDISCDNRFAVLGGIRYESRFADGTGTALVWDMEGREATLQLPIQDRPEFCKWMPDSRHILISSKAMPGKSGAHIPRGIQIVDVHGNRVERELDDDGASALSAAVTRDGRFVFASMGRIRPHQELKDLVLPRREMDTWNLRLFDYESGRKIGEMEAPVISRMKLFNGDNHLFGFSASTAYLWFLDWELAWDGPEGDIRSEHARQIQGGAEEDRNPGKENMSTDKTVWDGEKPDRNTRQHTDSSAETVYMPENRSGEGKGEGAETVYAPVQDAGETVLDAPGSAVAGAAEQQTDADRTVFEPDAGIAEGTLPEPAGESARQSAEPEKTGADEAEDDYARGSLLLDTYRIDSGALRGGMGSVWRVHHMGWNTDLAMKRPQRKYFTDDASRSNFIAECRSWIGLGLHPNIVSCYYVREVDGVPTIFSEWMENGSLENRIEDGTLYEGEDAEVRARLLDIAIQYARGLRYAHDSGLIHQDVKPDNLLLTPDWQAKAADFGLARARAVLTMAETDGDAGKTQMAASGGYTPAYCSMEQMDGKQLTRRTDIYSWAVSVLEMYLGARPWQNGVVAGMSCASYFPQCRVPMPEALQQLLEHCLEMNPEDRPHDFGVVEQELKSIYREVTGEEYARPEPRSAADTPDSLNNRALSYLDLGMQDEAARDWEAALKKEPDHALSLFNSGLAAIVRKKGIRDDGYAVLEDLEKMNSDVYLSNERRPDAEKQALLAALCRTGYEGRTAQMQLESALMHAEGAREKQSLQAELDRVRRAWFELPVHPGTCRRVCFDTDGKLCVIAWAEEGEQDEGEAGFLSVYDLASREQIRSRKLSDCRVSTRFERVILEGSIVHLIFPAGSGGSVAFETRTLNRRPDLDDDAFSGLNDGWPYVELQDGRRSLLQMRYVERQGNRAVTVRRKDPATLWLDALQPKARGGFGFGGPPRPEPDHNGLKASLPAVGMGSGQYAVCASHDRRWLLVFNKPYFTDQKRTFTILDTTVFGTLPEYTVARALSYSETSSRQSEQTRLLKQAQSCLNAGNVPGLLKALDAAFALYPDNPGDVWAGLNQAAGRLQHVKRQNLRGARKGRTMQEQDVDGNPEHGEAYMIGRHRGWEEKMQERNFESDDVFVRNGTAHLEVRFENTSRGCRCIGQDGREIALLPGIQAPEDAAGVLDPDAKILYFCADGLFTAWEIAGKSAVYRGGVRYGAPPGGDRLPQLHPSDRNTLWTQLPERVCLNRAENATVAMVWNRVLNAYGPEHITGFHSVTVIDLRTLHVLDTLFTHEDRLVNMPEEGMTVAEETLLDISRDGQLFLWSTPFGAVLRIVFEPDRMEKYTVGITGERIRQDGNALICTTTWSSKGNTYQEVLLDWQYACGTYETERRWTDILPENQCRCALGGAAGRAGPADDLADILAGLEQAAQSRIVVQSVSSKADDPLSDMLAEMERKARERMRGRK